MKKKKSLYVSMSRGEKLLGWLYLAFQLVFLPSVLGWINSKLGTPMSGSMLNFCYYVVNFVAIVCIFHRFLKDSLSAAWSGIWEFIQAVVLGYVAYWACSRVLTRVMGLLAPGFQNVNDSALIGMLQNDYILMAVGMVVLVPLAEEMLYRGLIFRNLYTHSKAAAYIVSMLAFAAIHVLGYLGSESVTTLVLCFIQYLPAGLCLAWTYTKADNIFAPIVVHALNNAIMIGLVR